jgi:hypothetical protein
MMSRRDACRIARRTGTVVWISMRYPNKAHVLDCMHNDCLRVLELRMRDEWPTIVIYMQGLHQRIRHPPPRHFEFGEGCKSAAKWRVGNHWLCAIGRFPVSRRNVHVRRGGAQVARCSAIILVSVSLSAFETSIATPVALQTPLRCSPVFINHRIPYPSAKLSLISLPASFSDSPIWCPRDLVDRRSTPHLNAQPQSHPTPLRTNPPTRSNHGRFQQEEGRRRRRQPHCSLRQPQEE